MYVYFHGVTIRKSRFFPSKCAWVELGIEVVRFPDKLLSTYTLKHVFQSLVFYLRRGKLLSWQFRIIVG